VNLYTEVGNCVASIIEPSGPGQKGGESPTSIKLPVNEQKDGRSGIGGGAGAWRGIVGIKTASSRVTEQTMASIREEKRSCEKKTTGGSGHNIIGGTLALSGHSSGTVRCAITMGSRGGDPVKRGITRKTTNWG